jgi:hypothetical protein
MRRELTPKRINVRARDASRLNRHRAARDAPRCAPTRIKARENSHRRRVARLGADAPRRVRERRAMRRRSSTRAR